MIEAEPRVSKIGIIMVLKKYFPGILFGASGDEEDQIYVQIYLAFEKNAPKFAQALSPWLTKTK